jgi:hypothetical protein
MAEPSGRLEQRLRDILHKTTSRFCDLLEIESQADPESPLSAASRNGDKITP